MGNYSDSALIRHMQLGFRHHQSQLSSAETAEQKLGQRSLIDHKIPMVSLLFYTNVLFNLLVLLSLKSQLAVEQWCAPLHGTLLGRSKRAPLNWSLGVPEQSWLCLGDTGHAHENRNLEATALESCEQAVHAQLVRLRQLQGLTV